MPGLLRDENLVVKHEAITAVWLMGVDFLRQSEQPVFEKIVAALENVRRNALVSESDQKKVDDILQEARGHLSLPLQIHYTMKDLSEGNVTQRTEAQRRLWQYYHKKPQEVYSQFIKYPQVDGVGSLRYASLKFMVGVGAAPIQFLSANTVNQLIDQLGKLSEHPRVSSREKDLIKEISKKLKTKHEQAAQLSDNSMVAEEYGGVNFNPTLIDLEIKRDQQGVPLPLIEQPIGAIQIDGLTPVIFEITPIVNPTLLLGTLQPSSDLKLSRF